jgi:hypothetical protein
MNSELPQRKRSCPAPVGVGRFVIRATHERGVGVPSSRSLATATREANVSVRRTTDQQCGNMDDWVQSQCRMGDYFNPNLLNVARRAWSAAMLF